MNTKAKPGSVTAVLVLLILIAVYQLLYGMFGLFSAVIIDATNVLDQMPTEFGAQAEAAEDMVWAAYTGAAIALVYGVAAVYLTVKVGKGAPQARTTALGVNAVFGVVALALVFTPVYGFGAVITALFAFTVVALLYNKSSKAYFGVAPEGNVPTRD